MWVGRMDRKGPRRLFPTTGTFMIEAVKDTCLYFTLLVSTILLQNRNFSQVTLGGY